MKYYLKIIPGNGFHPIKRFCIIKFNFHIHKKNCRTKTKIKFEGLIENLQLNYSYAQSTLCITLKHIFMNQDKKIIIEESKPSFVPDSGRL